MEHMKHDMNVVVNLIFDYDCEKRDHEQFIAI